ncbi:class IV adenylate cyclase [Solimonas marina]|uniref:Class IV adenylate cyclase n=1 Tax=Solimonas marina TaxID=2714601 RepID=A0A969W6D9_9GAMM|nr:class IV adenylate cyclase [Solimonas marina]NKF20744.1 class IV adenylate cyclase [Solimonas marina]
MARNIEIKARVADLAAVEMRAAALADRGPTDIAQDDTFFRCGNGRLKLRTFADGSGELIFYRRDDTRGPRTSFYLRTPVPTPDPLRESLTLAYGQAGRVRKQRRLYLAGRTRIHLDRVAGLGDFVELEVVLTDDEPIDAGTREARSLMAQLGMTTDALIDCAYVDLIAASDAGGTAPSAE